MSAPIGDSEGPGIKGEMAALRRAARKALQIGRETGTPVWVIKDGKIVDLTREHRKPQHKG